MRFHLGALGGLCVGIGLCLVLLVGCGETASRVSGGVRPQSTLTPTSTSAPAVTTGAKVQLGTGLHQSGTAVSIVNPTTSFTPTDNFAFIISLPSPIKSAQASCLIYDPQGNVLYSWTGRIEPGGKVVDSLTPPLGSIIPKDAPPGVYQLAVFSGSSSLIDHGSDGSFTYSG